MLLQIHKFSNSYNVKTSGFTTDRPIVAWTKLEAHTESTADTYTKILFPITFTTVYGYVNGAMCPNCSIKTGSSIGADSVAERDGTVEVLTNSYIKYRKVYGTSSDTWTYYAWIIGV